MERLATWSRRHTLAYDALLTVLLLLFILLFSASVSDTPGLFLMHRAVSQTIWCVILLLPMIMRRTQPQLSAIIFVGLVIIQLIVGPILVFSDFLALPLLFTVIVEDKEKRARIYIAIAFAVDIFASFIISWASTFGPILSEGNLSNNARSCVVGVNGQTLGYCVGLVVRTQLVLGLIIASLLLSTIVIAYWQRARLQTVRILQESNDAIAARESEERRNAVLSERARIARDMHDVVAHTLSIIIVQSDGGRYASTHDPALAKHTMLTIQEESLHALHDMKQLLGVFDGNDNATYGNVDRLIDQARSVSEHISITREIHGTPDPSALHANVQETLYRVVQESLTNIRKYAGNQVDVRIVETWDSGTVSIEIKDNGQGSNSSLDGHTAGYGLSGMKERVTAVGGIVDAGAQGTHGFTVSARIPYSRYSDTSVAIPQRDTTQRRKFAYSLDNHLINTTDSRKNDGTRESTLSIDSLVSHAFSHSDETMQSSDSEDNQIHSQIHTVTNIEPTAVVNTKTQQESTELVQSFAQKQQYSLSQFFTSRLSVERNSLIRWIWRRINQNPPAETRAGEVTETGSEANTHSQSRPHSHSNVIERLSRWTQQHYLLMDVLSMVLVLCIATSMDSNSTHLSFLFDAASPNNLAVWIIVERVFTVLLTLPLVTRRRFPEASALFVAIVCMVQLLFLPRVLTIDLLVLNYVYSAVVYGKENSWKWVLWASLANTVLFVCKIAGYSYSYPTTLSSILDLPNFTHNLGSFVNFISTGFGWGIMLAILVLGAVAMGRWTRLSGTNALVLQAREEALQAEQEQQNIYAANMERNRISTNIQNEVTETLNSVIVTTTSGLAMLDSFEKRGEEPPAQHIAESFAQIGTQGRQALARMRQLLRVLHETGISETGAHHGEESMQLTPMQPISEQLARL